MRTPVVLVKKPYMPTATRRMVLLRVDQPFDGTGTFTVTGGAANVKFFRLHKSGSEIKSGHVFPGKQLSAGIPIFAQGVKPSSSVNDITIQLSLKPGSAPVKPPASAKMTSVEVTLDICKSRTKSGEIPPPLSTSDKIKIGRFVQLQDAGFNAGRALLIVRKAEPKDFTGSLVLKSRNGSLKLYDFADDPPASGQSGFAEAKKPNAAIPASGLNFWVEGNATASAALRDTGYTLGVDGVDSEGDFVNVTVVSFSEINATIKPTPAHTPANSAALGLSKPASHSFKSAGLSRDFAVNAPLVLMRNAQPDIALAVKCVPAKLPLRWQAIRNEADHKSLGKQAEIPAVTQSSADPKKATLNANAAGSFRVRAYIDCNANNLYDDRIDREPSIPLNLVLANAVVVKDNSAGNAGGAAGNLQAAVTGGGVDIVNGLWPTGAAITKNDLKKAGMGMELIADVTGGGADGQLGLDKVFSGLVNNLSIVDINAAYLDSTVAPPKKWNWVNVYVSNRPASKIFAPGGPAPNLLTWPLLDTGRNPGGGTGGDTATMTRSGPQISVARPVGQRWTIRCVDSPARSFGFLHPLNANAAIQRIHYRQEFLACFCFWTNVNKNRGASFPGPQSNDPADRVYSVLRTVAWTVTGDWKVTFPAGVPTLTVTATHKVRLPSRSTIKPIGRAQDHTVEVRPPSGITGAIAWNAR